MPPSRRSAALVVLATLCGGGCREAPPPPRPNILLVTLDTTRADHLGCYGYGLPTSPNIDRLAELGTLYERAYAVSSWTLPAHASLFTGKHPSAHGSMYAPDGALGLHLGLEGEPAWERYRVDPIAEDELTLATVLAQAGYATGAVVAGPWLKAVFRLDAGFASYDDAGISELDGRDAAQVTDAAVRFLDAPRDGPFFLFLNYYDPHEPFQLRWDQLRTFSALGDDFARILQTLQQAGGRLDALTPEEARAVRVACYDSEIAYVDHHFGRLLQQMAARDLLRDTWIIVTADHGELLADGLLGGPPMWGHGLTLSEAEIRIPLVILPPGGSSPGGTRVDTPVQQVDLLPTILEALQIPLPEERAALLQGEPLGRRRTPVFAEVQPPPDSYPADMDPRLTGKWRVWLEGPWKFAWNSQGRHYLVDLASDPHEAVDLRQAQAARAGDLEERLLQYLSSLPEPGAVGEVEPVSEETLRTLRGLGYLDGGR